MVPPVIIQLTRDSDTSIDDESCETIARALGKQLARDVAPIHGIVPAVEYVPPGKVLEDAACIARIQRVSDTPGAAAYHDLNSKGQAFVRAFEDSTNGWLAGPESLAAALSHEFCEVVGDATANLWADGPRGISHALELCDATQGDTYEIDGVTVANFLYPAYFGLHAPKHTRLDHLGLIRKPFETRKGGYQIVRAAPGKVQEVFGGHNAMVNMHCMKGYGDREVWALFGADYDLERRREVLTKLHRTKKRRLGKEDYSVLDAGESD